MGAHESIFNLIYEERAYLAGRELSFITAVTELYGSAQARLSEKGLPRRIGTDGQSAIVYETTLASSHDRSLSSAGRPIEQRPVRSCDVLTN